MSLQVGAGSREEGCEQEVTLKQKLSDSEAFSKLHPICVPSLPPAVTG